MGSVLLLKWIGRCARTGALSKQYSTTWIRVRTEAILIRYRLLFIRHQSANSRAGGKTAEEKPKFPAINGGGREGRMPALADVQKICLETSYWLSGRPDWSVVHRVQSARSCAKFCNRSTLPRVILPLLPDRSFFLSRYSVLPRFPLLAPFYPLLSLHSRFPLSARGRCSLSPFIARHSDFN